MGRYRSRSRSHSPIHRRRSPPRRKHYDEPRRSSFSRTDRDRHRSPPPSGLLVRNIALNTRPEDLRTPFEKFGPVKDIYLPRNYYTGEPRGFGFVKFRYPEDAAEAKDRLNHTILGGREIRIVYAEENRKTPQEMRRITRPRYGERRTPPRSPRRRYHSDSRSPSSGRHYARSVSRSHSPRCKRDPRSSRRSPSPRAHSPDGRGHRGAKRSQSPRDISSHDMEFKSRRSYSPRAGSPDEKEYSARERSQSPKDKSPDDVDGKGRRSHTPRESSPYRSGSRAGDRPRDTQYKSRRSYSPRAGSPDGKNYRARERSRSTRDISPDDMDYKARRSHTPKASSPDGRGNRLRERSRDAEYESRRSFSPKASSPDGREYRGRERSRSQRDISPDDLDYKPRRSNTPMASSPDGRGKSARERSCGAEYKSRRSYSPRDIPSHDNQYRSNRRSYSPREISPPGRNELKSFKMSDSLRNESLGSMEHPIQETPMSSDISQCHYDDRLKRRSPGARVLGEHGGRSSTSPGDTRVSGYEENGESPLHCPGKKGRSISCSCSCSRSLSSSPR